jgi:hypothetical protein
LGETVLKQGVCIHPEMTILDILSRYRKTEDVFKQYDKQAGECICCQALFEPLGKVVATYGLNMEKLLTDLEADNAEIGYVQLFFGNGTTQNICP